MVAAMIATQKLAYTARLAVASGIIRSNRIRVCTMPSLEWHKKPAHTLTQEVLRDSLLGFTSRKAITLVRVVVSLNQLDRVCTCSKIADQDSKRSRRND